MMFDAAQFKKAKKQLELARKNIIAGNLPARMKLLVSVLFSFSKAHHDHEWCWVAQVELGRLAGIGERMVRKYTKAFHQIGAYKIETMAPRKFSALLMEKYGSGLPKNIRTKKNICAYQVLWNHELWQTGNLSGEDLATIQGIIRSSREAKPKPRSECQI